MPKDTVTHMYQTSHGGIPIDSIPCDVNDGYIRSSPRPVRTVSLSEVINNVWAEKYICPRCGGVVECDSIRVVVKCPCGYSANTGCSKGPYDVGPARRAAKNILGGLI